MQSSPPKRRHVWFPARASLLVALKELRTSLRDKNTVLYSVILPLCMYPVLFWAMIQVALVVQGRREQTTARLHVVASNSVLLPAGLEQRLVGHVENHGDEAPLEVELSRLDLEPAQAQQQARDVLAEPSEQAALRGDAFLWLGGDAESGQLFFESTRQRSRMAKQRTQERLDDFVERLREKALVANQSSLEPLHPFERLDVDVAPGRDKLAYLLSFILPMLLVTMCVLGAFFPAVDLTAGERERNTEETTMLLPAPRYAVHQGKILAVCITAVIATGCNLLALGLSASHLISMLGAGIGGGLSGVPTMALLSVTPLAVLFAFFVAAVLTGVASFARTFKEGQALLGPAQLLFILPAMIGVVPGIELSLKTACIPVVNVVLAFRGLLQGKILPMAYVVTVLSLLLFAILSIRASVWLLSREKRPARARMRFFSRRASGPPTPQIGA